VKKRTYVEWVDSSCGGPWTDIDELEASATLAIELKCFSIGFVAHEDERTLTLAMSYNLNRRGEVNQWGQPVTIPKVAITKRKSVAG
jgi:hypothetical protein